MRKEAKKILSFGLLTVGIIFLAGCGVKDVTTNAPMQKQGEKSATKAEEVKTPVPNGKVDTTVDAIIGGADSEKMQATSDEADVKALTDDSAESNNLNNTYEQEL
jgi:hypothetical protein